MADAGRRLRRCLSHEGVVMPVTGVQQIQGNPNGEPVPVSDVGVTLSAVSTLTSTAGVAPTLKNLANGSLVLSSEYDNTTTRYELMNPELLVRGASAFPTGAMVDCWIVPSIDGTDYTDGASGTTSPARVPDFTFWPIAVSTQQRLASGGPVPGLIPIPPCKFKILVRNTTVTSGVSFSNVDGESVLRVAFC